jgi:4-hydroxybenzoate polyprenyltransferase
MGVLAAAFPFPTSAIYAIPSVVIIGLYPLAKRVTHYPQVVLGFAWSWGIIMGFPAMGIDLFAPESSTALAAAGTLYAANIAWTVLYDTIYAHQDVKDDTRIGIKSMAVKHGAKNLLSGLAAVQVSLLAVTGWIVGAGPVYFLGTCGGATTALATMIWRMRLDMPENCWWWFKWGCWFTGGSVASGLMGEYWLRWKKQEDLKHAGGRVTAL